MFDLLFDLLGRGVAIEFEPGLPARVDCDGPNIGGEYLPIASAGQEFGARRRLRP